MDDTNRTSAHRAACGIALVMLAASLTSLSGCSLFVMAGKMLFGDPQVASPFRQSTGVKLANESKTVLIVCSSPASVKLRFPSLSYDVTDGFSRRLKRHGIDVVNPDNVADWMDDHGGTWGDLSDLAEQFHPDYIIHVELEQFDTQEENSPGLLRGNVDGSVFAYQVHNADGRPEAREIFVQEFHSTYPHHYPISADQMSARMFRQRQLEQLCDQMGQLFYDYRISEQIP